MPLVSGTMLLQCANSNQVAVPAFDVAGGNIDILHAVCQELAARKACAFLSSTPQSIEAYHGYQHFVQAVEWVADRYQVAVATHLDHAMEPSAIDLALSAGFTSVMFDGSKLPIDENIRLTREIVEKAQSFAASVEGELGIIAGKEEHVVADRSMFPTVEDSLRFVNETNVDLFAPAIGTAHGFYQGEPEIQWELASELHNFVDRPLVLHGGTGLEDVTLAKLLEMNFRKVNLATGVRAAFYAGVKESVCAGNRATKPQQYLATGRKAVQEFVSKSLKILIQ